MPRRHSSIETMANELSICEYLGHRERILSKTKHVGWIARKWCIWRVIECTREIVYLYEARVVERGGGVGSRRGGRGNNTGDAKTSENRTRKKNYTDGRDVGGAVLNGDEVEFADK